MLVARAFTGLVMLLTALNAGAAIVGGVWLAVRGDWWAVGRGVAVMLGGHFIVSLALAPGLLIGAAGLRRAERMRRTTALLLLAARNLYQAAVMLVWCLFVMAWFMDHPRAAGLLPILLWAYAVATSPWTYLAAKDQQGSGANEFTFVSLFGLQAGYALGGLLLLMGGPPAVFTLTLALALLVTWGVLQWMGRDAFASVEARPGRASR